MHARAGAGRRRAVATEEAPAGSAGSDEASYSIRVTSRLTAIELDTLRMWERRYGFPRPKRTSGGSRVYSASDVDALRLIKRAVEQGYRPGEVVGKPYDELVRLVLVASQAPASAAKEAPDIEVLLAGLGRDELPWLRAELHRAAVLLGPKRFLIEVAHPICIRVGALWAEGALEVRHEHMLSECLLAQLRVLRSTYNDRPDAPRVLLATLPNERHGLGLAMTEVYLAASHVTPVLLGVDTPAEQIVKAARSQSVDVVGLLVTEAADLKATKQQVRWMLGELPRRAGIWLGGAGGAQLGLSDDGVRVIGTWDEMDEAIEALPQRKP